MEFTFCKKKEDVLKILKNDINSNNRYVGEGYKIAGTIDADKIYLNLEDRMSKSSKFMNEVFFGEITEIEGCSTLKGKFRMDTYALVLLAILFIVALEALITTIILQGFGSAILFPVCIIVGIVLYFLLVKKRSRETNGYIIKYLNSIE